MAKPNILIVMTDHQRGDTVLPEHPCVAPNVTKLAEEGVIFSETFCPSPHCCPARATFHSGLYPTRSGVWNNVCNDQRLSTGLKPGIKLWSEDLKEQDYRLVWMGKWHVSIEESPADRGWEELSACGTGKDHHGRRWEQYEQLAAEPDDMERGEGEILRPGYGKYRLYGTSPRDAHTLDEQSTAQAVEALGKLSDGDQPWCMFVGLIGPHDPYVAPRPHLDLYDIDDVPLPPSFCDEMADKPRIVQRLRRQIWGQLTPREVREAVRHFWAYCSYLDELFGRILTALEATGQADDTLVIFTSDHGDYCGDHGLFAKGIPAYRGAYNVPLVMRWPNGIKNPGRRVDAFVSLADFAPTLIELAGGEAGREFSGASLTPFLADERPDDWRDEIHGQCNGVELFYTQRWVQTKQFKYVFNGFDDDELYDLRGDPHELRNVSENPAYAQIKRDMVRRMWRFARREGDAAINPYITVGLAPYGPAEAFRGD